IRQAVTLQLLGHVTKSAKTAEEALRQVRESKRLSSLAFTLAIKAILHCIRCEPEIARQQADDAISLSEEIGFGSLLDFARVALGWALAQLGQFNRALVEMEEGIRGLRNTGGGDRLHYYIAQLARSYAAVGQTEKALTMLNE